MSLLAPSSHSADISDEKGIHFEPDILKQFVIHITVYADMLLGWQLYSQRLELLQSVAPDIKKLTPTHISAELSNKGLGKQISVIITVISLY